MKRVSSSALILLAVFLAAPNAHAQRAGFVRLFRPYHQVVLAQLKEVSGDLKLTDEQKQKAADLSKKMNEERGALFQKAAGDFDSIREEMAKLNLDTAKAFNDALDETQRKRLQEIFIQANGPTALFDEQVAAALKLSKMQQDDLQKVRTDSRGAFTGIDWQSLSEKEMDAKVDELIAAQNEKYAAVMTDEQRAEFKVIEGAKLEIDLNKLPNPFGG